MRLGKFSLFQVSVVPEAIRYGTKGEHSVELSDQRKPTSVVVLGKIDSLYT